MRELTGKIAVFAVPIGDAMVATAAEIRRFPIKFPRHGTGNFDSHNREMDGRYQGMIRQLSGSISGSEPALPAAIDSFDLIVVFIAHLGIEQDEGKAATLPQHLFCHGRDLAGIAQA